MLFKCNKINVERWIMQLFKKEMWEAIISDLMVNTVLADYGRSAAATVIKSGSRALIQYEDAMLPA